MEVAKKLYIKGRSPLERLQNLQKIADTFYGGNFSAMVNDCLNRMFNLDSETGETLQNLGGASRVAAPQVPPFHKDRTPKKK